ncbi:hypothetical protein ACFL2V_05595 [Pseudomonadota bacterium]
MGFVSGHRKTNLWYDEDVILKNDRSGFTLIETLVALISLGLFFTALVVIFQSVTNLVAESKIRTVASAVANEKLEEVRNLPYVDIGTVGGIPQGVIPQDDVIIVNSQEFDVHTTIVYVDDPFDDVAPIDVIPTDYKRISVSVTWSGLYASKTPVHMVSDAAPDGLEMDEGGGTLIVEVVNASGVAVSGADITIFADQPDPDVNIQALSDSKGKLILPGAPECIGECYQVSVTRNGFSSDRTYSTTEVTNPSKPHATVLAGQVTQLVLTIDQLSNLNFVVTGSRETDYPPFMGVEFVLRGNKTIGTDALDQDVYKYEQNHVTAFGGIVTISNIEWDTYTIELPGGSTVDYAGSVPTNPFSLLPGQTLGVKMVVAPASTNSLLVITRTTSEGLIASASVTLRGPSSFIATDSGGLGGKGDQGQVLFPNLSVASYDLLIEKPGFKDATGSALVGGDVISLFVMENE